MDESPLHISLPPLFDRIHDSGPVGIFGWFSLLIVIIVGCSLLIVPPRRSRGVSWVDTFAACLHIQTLVFFLCVPLPLVMAAYLTLSMQPHVHDLVFSAASILINLTIAGVLLLLVSLRHKTTPTLEWSPAVSILTSVISLFAAWQCKMAAMMWYVD